ncbi:MAG: S46 family peptidase, partial [Vicinamibacteraceae bacterium]|nr:S46 family peptidase [Vicinamibacteraceae bacterium]
TFPWREKIFGEWIAAIEAATKDSDEGRIKVASDLKGLLNRYKNAQGQIAGLKRGRIPEKQAETDNAVAAWAASRPEHKAALEAREGLRAILAEQEKTWERDFLLSLVPFGLQPVPGSAGAFSKMLFHGVTVAHMARERAKPDAERETSFTEKDLARYEDRSAREEKSTFLPADREVFALYIERLLALPEDQRVPSVEQAFGAERGKPEALREKIAAMYEATPLRTEENRRELLRETEAGLAAMDDPFLDFALAFDADLRELRARQAAWEGRTSVLRPAWRRAVIAHAGKPVAPDANSTLRVSFAHVQGYSPRDAVIYEPQTTLAGALEKHTGEEPFDLPAKVRDAAAKAPQSRWADPRLKDIPIGFLADADTTGGNSGSPVVNGRGELVGLNFDRVWENVANDFGFNPDIARNVSVDVRYLLWMLQDIEGADGLVRELTMGGSGL